jgi:hypothetical protein
MKNTRKYAPFVKVANKWIRATYPANVGFDFETVGKEYPAYSKQTAIRIYQNWLLASAFGQTTEIRELRPVKN